jgi:hypothetical protein
MPPFVAEELHHSGSVTFSGESVAGGASDASAQITQAKRGALHTLARKS